MSRKNTVHTFARLLVVLLGFQLGTTALAAAEPDPLQGFLKELLTLQADFQQRLIGESGSVLQQASGTLWVQRPGKFRWDYTEPYQQLVMADGERLWNYDEDLAQVSVTAMDAALSATPAMLLSGVGEVTDVFLVTELGVVEGVHWVDLQPREKQSSFERISLGFVQDQLQIMEMRDLLGQRSRFDFTNIRRNHELSGELFQFSPPDGVDVIGSP